MWLPLNSTNECVIIINHQTFKFLIPQHTGTRIFISSEDALSLLLLFASPLAPFPPPQFAAVPLTSCTARGSGSTRSPPCPAGLSPELYAGFPEQPVTLPHLQGIPPSFLPSPTSLPFLFFYLGMVQPGQSLVLCRAQSARASFGDAEAEQDAQGGKQALFSSLTSSQTPLALPRTPLGKVLPRTHVLTALSDHKAMSPRRTLPPRFPPSFPRPINLSFTLEVMAATTPGATFSFGDS